MIKHLTINFINEYIQLFYKFNWYTFNPISIEFENESYLGEASIEIIILGLGVRISWLYNEDTPTRRKLKKYIKK